MTTVQIKVIGEHPPLTSNPINLYATEVLNSGYFKQIVCSPNIWLPPGLELEITPAIPGLYITSHSIWDGQICFLYHLGFEWKGPSEMKGKLVAYASIVEKPLAKVRFIQKDSQGIRIVTGDARQIENRNTETDTKPGE
jgi:hypothetical protein